MEGLAVFIALPAPIQQRSQTSQRGKPTSLGSLLILPHPPPMSQLLQAGSPGMHERISQGLLGEGFPCLKGNLLQGISIISCLLASTYLRIHKLSTDGVPHRDTYIHSYLEGLCEIIHPLF